MKTANTEFVLYHEPNHYLIMKFEVNQFFFSISTDLYPWLELDTQHHFSFGGSAHNQLSRLFVPSYLLFFHIIHF